MKDKLTRKIQEQTEVLRQSHDGLVSGIRRCLEEKGLNVNNVCVVEWRPDNTSFEFGIVVTSEKGVYGFGYTYPDKRESEGSFSEWTDLTNRWDSTPNAKSIGLALKLCEKTHDRLL